VIHEVRLRPEAEHDLADAAVWYEEQRQGLGVDLLDEVMAMFSMLAESPMLYPVVHRNTRRAIMHRFPFGIYYRIEGNTVLVIAVMHASRNPYRWKNRARPGELT